MKYQVKVLAEAEDDIFQIYKYIMINDSVNHAEYVFEQLEKFCLSLNSNPERGHFPPELEWAAITHYREIHFKPYRIIYEIEGKRVFIHCVFDGRRDLQQLLEQRLLR
jgi:toxin ParE1/3/4